jgi:hypothetical protein
MAAPCLACVQCSWCFLQRCVGAFRRRPTIAGPRDTVLPARSITLSRCTSCRRRCRSPTRSLCTSTTSCRWSRSWRAAASKPLGMCRRSPPTRRLLSVDPGLEAAAEIGAGGRGTPAEIATARGRAALREAPRRRVREGVVLRREVPAAFLQRSAGLLGVVCCPGPVYVRTPARLCLWVCCAVAWRRDGRRREQSASSGSEGEGSESFSRSTGSSAYSPTPSSHGSRSRVLTPGRSRDRGDPPEKRDRRSRGRHVARGSTAREPGAGTASTANSSRPAPKGMSPVNPLPWPCLPLWPLPCSSFFSLCGLCSVMCALTW